jgi:hypothetical protein
MRAVSAALLASAAFAAPVGAAESPGAKLTALKNVMDNDFTVDEEEMDALAQAMMEDGGGAPRDDDLLVER